MSRRGENIYKRKDGRWEGRYIKAHINGKSKYGYVYAKTYKEVKEKLSTVAISFNETKGISVSISKPMSEAGFEKVAAEWLETLKPRLKESSVVKYTNILKKYLLPYFKNNSIEAITREEIDDFIKVLLVEGYSGAGLAPKTVLSIVSVLKSVFEYADQYGKYDVADIRKLTVKQPQKSMRVLSISEQQKLSQYLCNDLTLINLGILVCLYTGVRIGEICALKWEDISFEEQYLYVHKTMQRIQNEKDAEKKTFIWISTPKSDCSIRKIPLPDELFKLLTKARCPDNTYFLTGLEDSFIEPRTLQNRFKAAIHICAIQDANFHALRHTFATRCVELGFDVKSLSEILGHASVNITLNRYVHPSMDLKQKNMNMFSNLFPVK
ncbi:tyrosine-type recombinase/integrase [bacterium]|nr:tyrosine-type recombinase/integrase [bacterium]